MEKYDAINAISKEIEHEKDLCRKYVELNPSDNDQREKCVTLQFLHFFGL